MTRPARPLTPLATALDRLLDAIVPVVAVRLPLERALGAMLAEPLLAPGPLPPRAIALRAGWAVASHDTVGASPYSPAHGGLSPVPVGVGDPLPPGADAVLDPGDVAQEGTLPEILAAASPGQGARRGGEDAAQGAVLRAAGARLRALDGGLARAAGLVEAQVRRPRVAVWSAGDEASAAYLAGALAGLADVVETRAFPDAVDLVVGVGEDALAEGIERLSDRGTLMGHGLAMAPGAGTACGMMAGAPVVLLPGRPEEAFAGLQLVVRPCLERLAGAPARQPDIAAPLLAKLSSAIGLAEIALLRREGGGLRPLAVGDLAWSALAAADAFTIVAPDREGHAAGETVGAFALETGP